MAYFLVFLGVHLASSAWISQILLNRELVILFLLYQRPVVVWCHLSLSMEMNQGVEGLQGLEVTTLFGRSRRRRQLLGGLGRRAERQQRGQVCAPRHGCLLDLAVCEGDHVIRRWEAEIDMVANQNDGASLEELAAEALVDEELGSMRIDSTQDVVEVDCLGARIDASCKVDTRLLATRQVDAVLANFGPVAVDEDFQVGFEGALA